MRETIRMKHFHLTKAVYSAYSKREILTKQILVRLEGFLDVFLIRGLLRLMA